jgi:hypothetical protein
MDFQRYAVASGIYQCYSCHGNKYKRWRPKVHAETIGLVTTANPGLWLCVLSDKTTQDVAKALPSVAANAGLCRVYGLHDQILAWYVHC